jgi:type IV pilus assembly protein PilC
MPNYSYLAKSLQGEEKTGEAEAADMRQLAKNLKEQGFILVKAFLEEDNGKKVFSISIPFMSGVSLTEKLMFTRNLKVMVASGLSLPRSLQVLSLQAKNQKFKNAILNIKEEVTKGKNFSDALSGYPGIFSELFQNMIKVGEETGNMENVLNILANQLERENELKSKILSALMYPSVIICAMLGIGILMLVMVVPKLAETFDELEIELPLTTRIIIGLGTFLSEKWYLFILLLVVLSFFFLIILRNKEIKKILDKFLLKTPIISSLIKKTNSASTIRTLSSLIKAGVPIVKSLEIISNTLGNFYYRESMLVSSERVAKGEKLSDVLALYQEIYPPVVLQMVRVGEETGETASVLEKLAEFFEDEVGNATKNLVSVMEPIIMLVVGAAIGFFAISMIQPMYSMLGSV